MVCDYCVRKARRTTGVCRGCGHDGVLPGLDRHGALICRACAGITMSLDCRRCGAEAELYREGTCWRCALADDVDALLVGPDGTTPPALQAFASALKDMPSANSGISYLRRSPGRDLLRQLAAGHVALSHEAFDALAPSRSVEFLRGLLMEHGALPRRDPYLATYLRWLDTKLAGIDHPDHRQLIETFARWHHLRRLHQQARSGGVAPSTFRLAKQTTTVAIGLLVWLAGRGRTIEDWTQHDVDAWFASGPSTRQHTLPFIYWAINTRRSRRLHVPRPGPRSHPKIGQNQRLAALRSLLLDDTIPLPWRVAGSLVLLYGQPANRIAQLTIDQISTRDAVRVRPADDWLDVPEPLATLMANYLQRRPNMLTANHIDSPWLFPGRMPGRPVTAERLVCELRAIGVPVMAAKTGTWQQLVREGPPSVLAEALGISPITAMKHAERAGADWLRYASLKRDPRTES